MALLWSAPATAFPESPRHYNLPGGEATQTLRKFSEASGREILYAADAVRGVRTSPVRGDFTAREALDQMLRRTRLAAVEDEKTGAFAVRPRTAGTEARSRSIEERAEVIRTASISGRASNLLTGHHLEGVRVTLHPQAAVALTGRDGHYRFAELVPGTYELTAAYTGLEPLSRNVEVEEGDAVELNLVLTSDVYLLDEYVVPGEREGSALALTLQRHAPSVKHVVAVDAYGSLAGNPAELLQRVPGVVPQFVGGDIRFVSIRGIASEMNAVQIDGNRIATINNDRAFQFQNVGSDHFESVEVIKAPTPDQDADWIGGAVNLRSRSAFDLTGRRITYSLGAIHQKAGRDDFHPAAAFSFSDVFSVFGGDRNLGISLSGGVRQHNGLVDRSWQDWQETDDRAAYLWRLRVQDYANVRTRYGGGLKIEYRLNDDAAIFANFTVSPHRENNAAPQFQLTASQALDALDGAGQPAGAGSILPGYTATRTEVRPAPGSRITLLSSHLKRKANAHTGQIGGRTRNEGWVFDYDASYSFAENNPFTLNTALTLPNIGWIVETGQNRSRWTPEFIFTDGPDPFNLDHYAAEPLSLSAGRVKNELFAAQINIRRDLSLMLPLYLKAGAKYREERLERFRGDRRWTYLGPDGIADSGDERMGAFLNAPYRQRAHRIFGFYPLFDYVSPGSLHEHAVSTPGEWREDNAYRLMRELTVRQSLSESITSAYVMGSGSKGPFSLLAGARIERTRVGGEGPLVQITPDEAARRRDWTGPVTDEELLRRTAAQYGGRRSVRRKYINIFPGAHVRLEPVEGWLLRASYTTGIGRPNFSSILPNDEIDRESQVVRANQVGLRPQHSGNFDAGIEYYFEPVGLLAAAWFRKDIKDFIFSTAGTVPAEGIGPGIGPEFSGYELRSQANGGFAKVHGFELSYQQQFALFSGRLGALGIYANASRLETSGNYGAGDTVRRTGMVAGFTPRAANAGISYLRGRFSLRANYGHKGRTLNIWNESASSRRWLLPSHRVDVKLKYAIRKGLDVYLDLYNLHGDNHREVWGVFERPYQILYRNDPEIHFGINGRF